MKVEAQAGELILDFLFKQTGQDDDLLTASFYEFNPHVRGDFFFANDGGFCACPCGDR